MRCICCGISVVLCRVSSRSLTHLLTHSLTCAYSLTYLLTYLFPCLLRYMLEVLFIFSNSIFILSSVLNTLGICFMITGIFSLTLTHSLLPTHLLTHPLTYLLTHSLTHSLTLTHLLLTIRYCNYGYITSK